MLTIHAQTDSRSIADQTADQLRTEGEAAGVVESILWNAARLGMQPAVEGRFVVAVER